MKAWLVERGHHPQGTNSAPLLNRRPLNSGPDCRRTCDSIGKRALAALSQRPAYAAQWRIARGDAFPGKPSRAVIF